MKMGFDEFKKVWETPFNGDYTKVFRKNLVEGINKAADYHAQMVRGSVEAMNKMHEMWKQGAEWYIDNHKKMAGFVADRLEKTEEEMSQSSGN